MLRWPGVRRLNKGVLTLKYVRAHEHRAIAMALPYVLEGLVSQDSVAQDCAIAYSAWRLELASESYVKSGSPSASQSCHASLETINKLGSNLQRLMNKLNAELASLRRARLEKAARDCADCIADEDSDDQGSSFSGDRRPARESCDDDDNVYRNNAAAVDVPVNDDIHGKGQSDAHRAILTWFHFTILGTIKFHKICHWPEWIEYFGNPSNYNGETWETAHKWYIKRWVGLLPHANATSMTSLIKRTLVFKAHGGSDLLYQKPADAHHTWYKVAGRNPDLSFRKLYIPRNDAWARIGNYILFRGGTPGGDVGLLMSIRSTGGGFTLGLNMCVCDNSDSKLSSYCQRWRVDEISAHTNAVRDILITQIEDYDVELYPMQRDFLSSTHFYSCPMMAIA